MNATRPAEILRQLETGAADAELLARFVSTKDAVAFAELVRRHAALVLGVCRRVTGHPQDAEDAFQATFLVLAQKAGSLRSAALLGNWLYGVAFRVAWRARRSAARRRTREVAMSVLPDTAAPSLLPTMPELNPILDEELAALAACYRDAIVLCDLQGASREEAALALGIPEGTLSSRLANGRKKLAARLTRRGVTLSVVALPLAVSEAQAATAVPNELLTKTCALVADFAAGGAVHGPLAKLIDGGFAMRKMLVFGVLVFGAVAGAVFAARPAENAPFEPPKPRAVAEKIAEQPQPKAEPKVAEKTVAYTTTPKMQRSFDLSVGALSVQWNATGTHLAVAGLERSFPPANRPVVWLFGLDASTKPISARPSDGERLLAVSRDGKSIVTDLREYKLISGNHQLNYWTETNPPAPMGTGAPGGAPVLGVSKTVKLDATEAHGYTFAADMKTYRTVVWDQAVSGGNPVKLEVLEVDATTGKTLKSLLKSDYGEHVLSANGKRIAIVDKDLAKVTVYDIESGAKASEFTFPADVAVELPGGKTVELPRLPERPVLRFSPDGRRLVVSRGIGRTHVLNADTGAPLPSLEGMSLAELFMDADAFSSDGRLLVAPRRVYRVAVAGLKAPNPKAAKEQTSWSGDLTLLTVWDTQTGKVLKSWNSGGVVRVAFSPTQPLLAVLEENGERNTRVGFWDFAAEVEKK